MKVPAEVPAEVPADSLHELFIMAKYCCITYFY